MLNLHPIKVNVKTGQKVSRQRQRSHMEPRGKSREVKRRLRELVPNATMEDFLAIEKIADAGHLRHLPPSIKAIQAITSHARHAHTEYNALLEDGYDQDSARHFVLDDINAKLQEWGCKETISENE